MYLSTKSGKEHAKTDGDHNGGGCSFRLVAGGYGGPFLVPLFVECSAATGTAASAVSI